MYVSANTVWVTPPHPVPVAGVSEYAAINVLCCTGAAFFRPRGCRRHPDEGCNRRGNGPTPFRGVTNGNQSDVDVEIKGGYFFLNNCCERTYLQDMPSGVASKAQRDRLLLQRPIAWKMLKHLRMLYLQK